MKTNIEELGNNKVKMEIEVDAKAFDEAMEKAYLKKRGSITIPGFRKGKAPRKVIENYYGEGIFYEEAINHACPEAYDKAVESNGLKPVDYPDIDIVQIGEGKNLIFTAEVTLRPEVELGQYKGIEINKIEYNVTSQDIDKRVEQAREENARWISVEDRPVQEGDLLTIDYKGYVDGEAFEGGTAENQSLEIGSGNFIPGFEEQLIGADIDEERDIKVTFPEEYHAEELAGKEATFTVKIHEIKKKELPELDDEFIKDISEFDTIEEYKAGLKKDMEESAKKEAEIKMENQLIEKVVENATVDIPGVMVDQEVDTIVRDMNMRLGYQGMNLETYLEVTNSSMDEFRAQFKDEAYNRVKLQLTLDQIIKEEKIEASQDEVEKEYEAIADQYGIDIDRVKKEYKGQEANIENKIAIEKVVKFLMEEAVVGEVAEEQEDKVEKEGGEKED